MISTDSIKIEILNNTYSREYLSSPKEVSMLTLLSGQNQIRINGSVINTKKNYLFLVPSSMELSIKGNGNAIHFSSNITTVDKILNVSLATTIRLYFNTQLKGQSFYCFPLDSSACLKIDTIFHNILKELEFRKSDYKEVTELYFLEILFMLKRAGTINKDELFNYGTTDTIWTILDVVYYIDRNFDSSFTLNELAARCALNSSYFSRAFKIEVGVPLFEYINRLRIDKACQLLKSSSMSIIDIAFSVGYNNVSFFNRYFKKIINNSPGEYRRRIRG